MTAKEHRVRVWDVPTRLFHWTLVTLIVVSFVTGNIGGNAMIWHMRSGYVILALVAFRLVWGFVGGRESRFASFVRGPAAVLRYARALRTGETPEYLGHNPLGGWSVLLLLASIALQAATGLFANDDIATEGPLAAMVSSATSSLLTKVHLVNQWVLVALVSLHLVAILFYLFVKDQNLVYPMVSGEKVASTGTEETRERPLLALALVAAAGLAVWLVVR